MMKLLSKYRSRLTAGLAMALSCAAATAATGADLERGQQIAAQRCGVCHATDLKSESPHNITPPLRDLHRRFPIDMLVEATRSGLVSGHDEMPMFQFSLTEVRDLIAYIDSLSPANARYLKN
jgi:mono/diheme cytochrome c family protein